MPAFSLPRPNVTNLFEGGHSPARVPHVLIADDDRVIRTVLASLLEDQGYRVLEAPDGSSAFTLLTQNASSLDAALIDRDMPGLDGLALIRLMQNKPELAHVPTIMVTGADAPQQVREGLRAGVFYYLTKPVDRAVVAAVVDSAVREGQRRRTLGRQLQQRSGLNLLQQGLFTLHTCAEADMLASQLAPLFPQPDRALSGIAALILNAVEHGLLGIGYSLKGKLLADNTWSQEVTTRENMPEHADKVVRVQVVRQPDRTVLTVADPGPGFDWRNYIDLSQERAMARHGRGIAQARASGFDKLSYNASGNIVQVEAGVRPELEW